VGRARGVELCADMARSGSDRWDAANHDRSTKSGVSVTSAKAVSDGQTSGITVTDIAWGGDSFGVVWRYVVSGGPGSGFFLKRFNAATEELGLQQQLPLSNLSTISTARVGTCRLRRDRLDSRVAGVVPTPVPTQGRQGSTRPRSGYCREPGHRGRSEHQPSGVIRARAQRVHDRHRRDGRGPRVSE